MASGYQMDSADRVALALEGLGGEPSSITD